MRIFRAINSFIFLKMLYHVKFTGYNNIPKDKPVVLAANHTSLLDGIFMWCKVKNIAIMAKKELFNFKPLAVLFKGIGLFPIARGEKDFKSILHAVNILKSPGNRRLLIFPEGTRNAKQKNVKAKVGAVYIAKSANVDIVPVYISEEKNRIFKRSVITFGKPYSVTEDNDKKVLKEETEELMNKIYNLKGMK